MFKKLCNYGSLALSVLRSKKYRRVEPLVLFMFFLFIILKPNIPFKKDPFFLSENIKKQNKKIRVLLEEKNSVNENVFQVESEDAIVVTSPHTTKKVLINAKQLKATVKNNNIFLSITNPETNVTKTKKVKFNEIKLIPTKNNLTFDKKPYQGTLTLTIDQANNTLLVINSLDLDDYIYSVLVSESYQAWPHEMQKIQATISRTYAVHRMIETRKNKNNLLFDLKRTNFHQTYNGHHNFTHLREAIHDTHGLILTHNHKNVVLAMFDACCGGIIPANIKNTIDFEKAPYLARNNPCTYCKNYKLYKWHREIPIKNFLETLKNNSLTAKKLINSGNLINIQALEKDKAGIIHKVKFCFNNKNVTLTGKELWQSMRDKIKSLNFNIKKINDKVIIDGNGFGHQIGLCQRGARELVRKGWDYKKILSFYYPKTKLARLKYA